MIFVLQEEVERRYAELLWLVAGGSKTEYDALRGTGVIEFYRLLKIYHKQLKKKADGKNRN